MFKIFSISLAFRFAVTFLLGLCPTAKAQLSVFLGPIPEGEASYTSESCPADQTAAQYIATLNARGENGERLVGLFAESPSSSYKLFVNDSSQPGAIAYASEPFVQGRMAILSQANARGSQGFRLGSGQVFVSNGETTAINVYSRAFGESGTFVYEAENAPINSVAYEALLNARADQGFIQYAPFVFDSDPLDTGLLFERVSSGDAGDYLALPVQATRFSFLDQLNGQGREGFRYLGNFFAGGEQTSLFFKQTGEMRSFEYSLEPQFVSQNAAVADFNQKSTEGLIFQSVIIEPSTTNIVSLFVSISSEPVKSVEVATLTISADCILTVDPAASGDFQLEESDSLGRWLPRGEVISAVGSYTVDLKSFSDGPTHFYRVRRMP